MKRLPHFDAWFDSLPDGRTRIRLARRLDKVQRGLLGDVAPVGEGVWEMREFFGPGWRMYFVERDGTLVVMLGGGDKSTQPQDIARAIELAATLGE
ncbi:MAG: type II toxin-antitoxin system RelE/ParE family toxin [Rhodocyclaceae bacterium]|nr:type II toxin-antitoxin system RelE/ParE family toxin [Rhodocyclaceae bacterium]